MTVTMGQGLSTDPTDRSANAAHIGSRLARLRELAGMSQTELAARLGIHRASIARVEARADVKTLAARAYVEALGGQLRVDAHFDRIRLGLDDGSMSGRDDDGDQFVLPLIPDHRLLARRDVILSIKPRYAERILDGTKTVELRRRFPTAVPKGTTALIYTSSPTRAITGFAEITDVVVEKAEAIWEAFGEQACVTRDDFDRYFDGMEIGCAIRLAGARAFRRSVALPELRDRFSFEPPQSFLYAKPHLRQALGHEFSELPY